MAGDTYHINEVNEHMDVVSAMLEMPIHVTEMLDGRHWQVTASRSERSSEFIHITVEMFDDNQARHAEDVHVLYDQRLDYMLFDMLTNAQDAIESITLHGVYLTPSENENPYFLTKPEVRVFDLEFNGRSIDASIAFAFFDCYAVAHVPVLSLPGQTLADWLCRRPVQQAAKGTSKLVMADRAGVVIRPTSEHDHPSIGRMILKALVFEDAPCGAAE